MAKRNLPEVSRDRNLWSTVGNINRLQRGLDRVFEELLTGASFPSLLGSRRSFLEEQGAFIPPVDIEETDTHYLIAFDIPGIKKQDVRVELRDNQLVVSGERKEESEKGNRIAEERFYGSFVRTMTLPSHVDSNQVEASYEDGVLQIVVPKKEEAKAKSVEIKKGKLLEKKAA